MTAISKTEFEQKLLSFISGLASESKHIQKTTKLFDDGVIDSLKILDLIAFVEAALNIKIPDSKVVIDNFRSIAAITEAFWKEKSTYAKR